MTLEQLKQEYLQICCDIGQLEIKKVILLNQASLKEQEYLKLEKEMNDQTKSQSAISTSI